MCVCNPFCMFRIPSEGLLWGIEPAQNFLTVEKVSHSCHAKPSTKQSLTHVVTTPYHAQPQFLRVCTLAVCS